MRVKFLIRYAIRSLARFAVVLATRSIEALRIGAYSLKAVLETFLVLTLAYLYVLAGVPSSLAIILAESNRGLTYQPITREMIVNAIMPTLRTLLVFFAAVYFFRYVFEPELSYAYAGITLSTIALLVGVIAGHNIPLRPIIVVALMLALISSVHTYYYAVNMLEPYSKRLDRIHLVLRGHTHVPIERLRRYVKEMRSKDPNFRSRLTLEREIRKISHVAVAAMIGSIASIALAIVLAYGTLYFARLVFTHALYRAIADSVETTQPELFLVFVGRLASLLYLISLRYSGILSTEK